MIEALKFRHVAFAAALAAGCAHEAALPPEIEAPVPTPPITTKDEGAVIELSHSGMKEILQHEETELLEIAVFGGRLACRRLDLDLQPATAEDPYLQYIPHFEAMSGGSITLKEAEFWEHYRRNIVDSYEDNSGSSDYNDWYKPFRKWHAIFSENRDDYCWKVYKNI